MGFNPIDLIADTHTQSLLTQLISDLAVLLQLLLDGLQTSRNALQLFRRLFGGREVSRGSVGSGEGGDLDRDLRGEQGAGMREKRERKRMLVRIFGIRGKMDRGGGSHEVVDRLGIRGNCEHAP
jgi:hypothetical protein